MDEPKAVPRIAGASRVVSQSRRRAEPKLEVIKMLSRDCADFSKTCGNDSGKQICTNYVDDNGRQGFEARQCCSSKLGKFGVIEDDGNHDNCLNLERRMDVNKSQQTETDKVESKTGSHSLQSQQNLVAKSDISKLKELDSHAGTWDLGNEPVLRKKENSSNCVSASHVLHYTVCLHGWGNIVLFCDSVAL